MWPVIVEKNQPTCACVTVTCDGTRRLFVFLCSPLASRRPGSSGRESTKLCWPWKEHGGEINSLGILPFSLVS